MSASRFRDTDRVLLPLIRPAMGWCLAALLYISTAATAQETPAEPTKLDKVTVTGEKEAPYTVEQTAAATKLSLSPRETPQSVTVITRERMDDQNMESMRDVLDNTTGVYSYAYDSERVVFTSRGFTIDSTLYDGVPVPAGLNASSTDASLDTALYERIEIVRGATGLLTGAGSPSASVNLVRKHADAKSFEGEATLSYGSWDDFRSVADVSTPLTASGNVRARVVGVYQNRDSYMDLYSNEKQVFYGIIDADLTPRTRLSLGYDYQQTLPQGNTWGSFPLFFSDATRTHWPIDVTTAADWSYWNNRTQTAFAELQHEFGNEWTLRATAMRRSQDSDANLFYVYGFPDRDSGEGLIPFAYRDHNAVRQNSLDAYLTGPFEFLGRKHELVVGAAGSWLHGDEYEFAHDELPDIGNFFEWDGSYPEPAFSSESSLAGRIRTHQSAAYAALRLAVADPLKLIAGARYDHWASDHFYIYDDRDPFIVDYKEVTPYAGLIYDFASEWSAFASYTTIFMPQFNQRKDGSYIDPREGHSSEIGIKGEHFGGRLNTSLTLFDTQQDNVAVAEFGEDVLDDPTRQAFTEADGTSTRGFELEASGEILKDWNLSLGWSNYSMKDGDDQNIKAYIPRTLVRAFTSYTLPGALQNLTVGGGVNWQSRNHIDAEAPDPESEEGATTTQRVEQKAVTLLSLMARYKLTPELSVQVNGNNLLDEQYYVIDEYGNLYYGEPVSATLSLNYRF